MSDVILFYGYNKVAKWYSRIDDDLDEDEMIVKKKLKEEPNVAQLDQADITFDKENDAVIELNSLSGSESTEQDDQQCDIIGENGTTDLHFNLVKKMVDLTINKVGLYYYG